MAKKLTKRKNIKNWKKGLNTTLATSVTNTTNQRKGTILPSIN